MEDDEVGAYAAAREMYEESDGIIDLRGYPAKVNSVDDRSQNVTIRYIFFMALQHEGILKMKQMSFKPVNDEIDEIRIVPISDIPSYNLCFGQDKIVLPNYHPNIVPQFKLPEQFIV
jgi:ADP-ribose pyrophosphatase YjhB (NUDIX family)